MQPAHALRDLFRSRVLPCVDRAYRRVLARGSRNTPGCFECSATTDTPSGTPLATVHVTTHAVTRETLGYGQHPATRRSHGGSPTARRSQLRESRGSGTWRR